MILDLTHMDYSNRLRVLNITIIETSIEGRRLRAELLEVFNTFNGLDSIMLADFFDTDKARHATRGHPFQNCKKV